MSTEEFKTLPVGRYEIEGDDIFALVQDQTTDKPENKRAESHRNYVDIQYLMSGEEKQGYAPLLPGVKGEEPAGKDNIFYGEVEGEQFVCLKPGDFTIYFTDDIHRPNCAVGESMGIHKAVIKIRESLIK
jgi:YhcH/YjgK/YiaL family protein